MAKVTKKDAGRGCSHDVKNGPMKDPSFGDLQAGESAVRTPMAERTDKMSRKKTSKIPGVTGR